MKTTYNEYYFCALREKYQREIKLYHYFLAIDVVLFIVVSFFAFELLALFPSQFSWRLPKGTLYILNSNSFALRGFLSYTISFFAFRFARFLMNVYIKKRVKSEENYLEFQVAYQQKNIKIPQKSSSIIFGTLLVIVILVFSIHCFQIIYDTRASLKVYCFDFRQPSLQTVVYEKIEQVFFVIDDPDSSKTIFYDANQKEISQLVFQNRLHKESTEFCLKIIDKRTDNAYNLFHNFVKEYDENDVRSNAYVRK